MAAFSVRKKTTHKKEPIGFERKPAVRRQDKNKPSTDPDETQVPGSDRDPSQTQIQPNAVLKRTKNSVRLASSKLRRYLSKTMVGVWNVAVF